MTTVSSPRVKILGLDYQSPQEAVDAGLAHPGAEKFVVAQTDDLQKVYVAIKASTGSWQVIDQRTGVFDPRRT
jgi:hypothetical protein